MKITSERFWARFCLAGVALWGVLIGAFAIDMLVIPHGPNFAIPMGPQGTFIVFGGVFSVGYVCCLSVVGVVLAYIRWELRLRDAGKEIS